MYIEDKYCRIFHSDNITRCKYNELYSYAVFLRDHKNIVSDYVNQNLFKYIEYCKNDFVKEMRSIYYGIISSSFDYQLYSQVYTSYMNKFNGIIKRIVFNAIIYKGVEYYTDDTINNKSGDFKKFKTTTKNTKLTSCLSYLARYGNETSKEYIEVQLETNTNLTASKKKYYMNILECIETYGFTRLYKLAMMKRTNVIKWYSKYKVEFKSLTFSGRSRKKDIIAYNKNFNSKINAFIELSWSSRDSLFIPVKYSKTWFKNLKDYN